MNIKLIFLLCCAFVFANEYEFIELSNNKEELSKEIFKKLEREHYLKELNKDNFNKKYFEAIIEKLDENKNLFIKDEIELYLKRSDLYDDYFDIELAYELINLYFERLMYFLKYQIELIKKNQFDLLKDEYLDIYNEDNQWQSSFDDLKEIWRLETKNDLLVSTLSDSSSSTPLVDLKKRYENRIRRINQQKEEDIFSLAINILTNQFDPHSSYLSPRSAEDFDVNMSLKLNGIGALLGTEDDYTKIISLVPGGPAEKSGKINPEDRITKIRQIGSNEYKDVVGWRIDEVVDLIRGEAGSEVEIEFISFNSDDDSTKLITLKREEIKLEDRAAKSKIIDIGDNKIGIIDLPSFYIDFNDYQKRVEDYRSSSKDVKSILNEFNQSDVDALILDLRNNGGGALIEANKIIGLFVSSGPTVQVKQSRGYIQPYGSSRAVQVWSKPMLVLVNRYSASASEIVAGAIQDYRRGIIVGQRTFGKGTVQSLENLSEGQVKITESKYYRVNGMSTQNKGVLPDIQLPVTWDINSVGESSYPTAMEWDVIRPYRHNKFNIDSNLFNEVVANYEYRLNEEPNLNYLKKVRDRYDLNKNKRKLSLNLNERKIQKELRKDWLLQIENERRQKVGLAIYSSYEEMQESSDTGITSSEINLEDDYQLIESTNIINDYIELNKKFALSSIK
ncbi:MAG: peptidase [Gammaproteobacteria bacterium]|nr:peptidase [Gammaproteobacteria bacterium]|tara:strand:- start:18983 stop:21010 length:2028 start_codon:yes stop_codon:yes gene_type:complete